MPPLCDRQFRRGHLFARVYELKGETQDQALQEIVRVLRPKGTFLMIMMEHDVPANPLVRILFYLRLPFVGAERAVIFLRHEREVLGTVLPERRESRGPAG